MALRSAACIVPLRFRQVSLALLQLARPNEERQRVARSQTSDAVDVGVMLVRRCSPARGRGDRDLHQSLLPRSSLRLRDTSSRNEERGHPPFLRQPAVLVAQRVKVPRRLPRRGGSLAAEVDDPANGVRLPPADPSSRHGVVEAACVLVIALVALVLAPLASARGSGGERGSAAAHHGHVNAAGGSRAEALPLELANAADGSRAAGRQQRHPNSRSSEEEEDEGEEEMEWQAEVDQEEIEEKQGEQQEEQHEGHDDDGDDWRR